MNTVKVAITLPLKVLETIDRLANKYNLSRSRFITRSLEENAKQLLEEEIAQSYDEVFSDPQVNREQLEWSEGALKISEEIVKTWK